MKTNFAIAFMLALPSAVFAHEGHSHAASPKTQKKIVQLNTENRNITSLSSGKPQKRIDQSSQSYLIRSQEKSKCVLIATFCLLNPTVYLTTP